MKVLAEDRMGLLIEGGQALAPGLTIFGHVLVVPAVGQPGQQPLVDQLGDRNLRLIVLGQQQVEQGTDRRLLGGVKERQLRVRVESGQHHPGGHQIPAAHLAQHVEVTEAALVARGDRITLRGPARQVLAHRSPSRRNSEARIPMPPTIAASRGANMGGPISML